MHTFRCRREVATQKAHMHGAAQANTKQDQCGTDNLTSKLGVCVFTDVISQLIFSYRNHHASDHSQERMSEGARSNRDRP